MALFAQTRWRRRTGVLSFIRAVKRRVPSIDLGQDDIVIDTQGHCFALRNGANNTVELDLLPQTLSVQQVTELIQKHEFAQAQRCIIKIHFTSVQQAIEALAD